MNKHIKELAVKSGFPEWSNTTIGFELEQFAELIIQECIDIVLDSDPSPKMSVREPYDSIMENIKKHFGWHDE